MGVNQKIFVAVCLTIAVCALVVQFIVLPSIYSPGPTLQFSGAPYPYQTAHFVRCQ